MTNRSYKHAGATVLAIVLATGFLIYAQQQEPKTADGSRTRQSMEEMNERGDKAMGFDHMKTTHHFLLTNDGGVIQVEANQASDRESSDQIRKHLRHIAIAFSEGDFDTPMFVHAESPPGIEAMKRLKSEISYKFEETSRGGRVRIASNNAEAITAIHDFLTFQIKEHKTGDPLKVVK